MAHLQALPQVLKTTDCQVVILGTGKKAFEKKVEELSKKFEGCEGIVKFSAPLAHMITAGVDFLMVPSRFEPCGLIQLHAMQYGTVPVVSSTGGLVDTVKEGAYPELCCFFVACALVIRTLNIHVCSSQGLGERRTEERGCAGRQLNCTETFGTVSLVVTSL